MKNFTLSTLMLFGILQLFAQTTVNIYPQKDNTLFEDSNSSCNPDCSNGAGIYLFAGETSRFGARRCLLQFDVAANIPTGATISSVELDMNINFVLNGTGSTTMFLHKITQDWGEAGSDAGGSASGGGGGGATPQNNDATWNFAFFNTQSWNTIGGDIVNTASGQTTAPAAQQIITFTSTTAMINDVNDWLNTPANNFGWLVKAPENSGITSRRFGAREHTDINQRPVLRVTYNTNATPIDLQNFTTLTTKSGIILNWETSSEVDNAYFEIEHSQDGKNFSSIGQINGQGQSDEIHKYQWVDKNPFEGNNFYRLKQVDFSGKFSFSSTRLNYWTAAVYNKVTILQNPIQDILSLDLQITDNKPINLQLFNLKGQLLRQKEVKDSTNIIWSLHDLPAGIYILKSKKGVWKILKQ